MARKQLNLQTVFEDFEQGKVGQQFNLLLMQLGKDCFDRPGVDKTRKVTLEVQAKPICDEAGMAEAVKVRIALQGRQPEYGSREVTALIQKSGAIVFDDFSDDVQQTTML